MSSGTTDIPQSKYALMEFDELGAYNVRNKKAKFLFKSYFNYSSLTSDKSE